MWSYNSSIAEWVRESQWAVAILEVFHLFGLIFLLGSVFMIGLRCFGLAMQRDPVEKVVRSLAPATLGGLALMTITGGLIFSSGVTRYVDSPPFQFKMFCYFSAIVIQCVIYIVAFRKKDEDRRLNPMWMVMGGLAFLLWFGVGIAGRAIAFI
jgi:cytochrome bd-type quinol oxidase subunit 2